MKRPATENVADVLQALAHQYGWEDRLDEEKARQILLDLLDAPTRAHVLSVRFDKNPARRGVCYLQTDSAAARQNLSFHLENLKSEVNRLAEADVISSLRLV